MLKAKERVLSIDVFRGVVIFLMIFVNDLAMVRNIPQWLKHMPAEADAMTLVDMVFPAFLFIVGMSIPFAINDRIDKNEPIHKILFHIFIRTAGLIGLGVLMVNISGLNEAASGINKHLWAILLFVFAILVWMKYPKREGKANIIYKGLHILGIIGLVFLAAIYRSGSEEEIRWLRTYWWGILGLIGWAYCASSILYLIFKNRIEAFPALIAGCVFLFIGDKTGALNFLGPINQYIFIGGHIGSHSLLVLSGILISMIISNNKRRNGFRERAIWILSFSCLAAFSGYLLRPLYGISKIWATPSWSLYCAAFCSLFYLAVHYIIDEKQIIKWSRAFEPAGANPLLAYILPDIFYAAAGLLSINLVYDIFGEGVFGSLKSILFSAIVVAITGALTKLKIRLQM